MTTAIFDTLQYAKKAEVEGFPKKQAEFLAESLQDILNTQLATKADLKYEVGDLKKEIELKLEQVKTQIAYWAFGIIAGQVALIITVLMRMVR